jgi:peptidyl-prolyl cis-trans isomerase SurA
LKRIARALFAFVLVAAVLSSARAQSPAPGARPPAPPPAKTAAGAERLDGIAAVVNDDAVLESDVEEQLYLYLMQAQIRPDSASIDTLRRQILNQLIDEKLIVAEAKHQGITATDAEINKQLDQAIASKKEQLGGEQAFLEQLQKENTTEAKLREKYHGDLERELLAQRLVEKQFPHRHGGVTATEAEAYFKANREKFPKVSAEVKVQLIQIPARADSVAEAKAKAKALEARRRIANGEKFAKVAADVSEDPNSARAGGDLGFLPRGSLDRRLDDAVFSLKLNELSPPVRSAVGWHLLEVFERDTLKTRAKKDSLDSSGKPIPEAHVRHILFRVPVEDADIARARQLAERVRALAVKDGANFGALARQYSQYEGQQDESGDLGFIPLGTLQPNIRAALDTIAVGRVSEVLENPAGFNIFKVNDRKPERMYELEEVRGELPDVVDQMKRRDRYEEWMKGLRAKAHIEIRGS